MTSQGDVIGVLQLVNARDRDGALQPAYAGIRPKPHAPDAAACDFLVSGPAEHGIGGLVCLYGIGGDVSLAAIGEKLQSGDITTERMTETLYRSLTAD